MSWRRRALFIAAARRRNRGGEVNAPHAATVAAIIASRPLLTTVLLLGCSIGGCYQIYSFIADDVPNTKTRHRCRPDDCQRNRQHQLLRFSSAALCADVLDKNHPVSSKSVSLLSTRSSSSSSRTSTTTKQNYQSSSSSIRTYSTKADLFFQKHHKIPLPQRVHDTLDRMLQDKKTHTERLSSGPEEEEEQQQQQQKQQPDQQIVVNDDKKQFTITDDDNNSKNKIFIIGDVHGCLTELKLLIQKATKTQEDDDEHNNNDSHNNFHAIILVGDLVNKGPNSAEVIQFVRNQKNMFAVRGNHDDCALAAALSLGDDTDDKECNYKSNYDWVCQLRDQDIEWYAELPYTITIPASLLQHHQQQQNHDDDSDSKQQDVIVVHAGLLPNVPLKDQHTKTMTTIRDYVILKPSDSVHGNSRTGSNEEERREPIAKAWTGPQLVIFGHDARRGLQQEEYAIGLDTGLVYGKRLTGIILPDRVFVSVDALEEYSPVKR